MPTQLPLIKVDKALESLRASGFDIPAAVGEPVDNALQAKANTIKIKLVEGERKAGKAQTKRLVVEQIAFADDGLGMSSDVLHQCLVLGYSTRYDNRSGMGRFGVGATLAGISQAKRLEVYSRTGGKDPYLYSYLDLDEIEAGNQKFMPPPTARTLPNEFTNLMGKGSGTLVIWSKCDRLVQGQDGTVLDFNRVRSDLKEWLSRTYRYFIDNGTKIELDDTPIEPHDPLYLMNVPRFADDVRFSTEPKAEVILEETFDWPIPADPVARTSPIRVRMTLLPQSWRLKRGWGDARPARDRKIDENEGFSILRANREIFYGMSPKFYPGAGDGIDRWHGIEIAFEPALDECFRVRNVKKGAEPVEGLRGKLKQLLKPHIDSARKRVKTTYVDEDNRVKGANGIHQEAEQIVATIEPTSPKARSGRNVSGKERDAKLTELATQAAETPAAKGQPEVTMEEIKERLQRLPYSIIDAQWPGKEFIEIEHLGENTIIKLNNRHPFFTKIYAPVLRASGALAKSENENGLEPLSQEDVREMARVVQTGLDLLVAAYAKAESMVADPEIQYGDLRTDWGKFLFNLVQQLP